MFVYRVSRLSVRDIKNFSHVNYQIKSIKLISEDSEKWIYEVIITLNNNDLTYVLTIFKNDRYKKVVFIASDTNKIIEVELEDYDNVGELVSQIAIAFTLFEVYVSDSSRWVYYSSSDTIYVKTFPSDY